MTGTAWDAWRAGWVGLALLCALAVLGWYVQRRRGYVTRRWPRLNRGYWWAVVSIVTSAAVALIPLAAAGDLGVEAIRVQVGASVLYLVQGNLGDGEAS